MKQRTSSWTLKELLQETAAVYTNNKWSTNPLALTCGLTEEVGEIAAIILRNTPAIILRNTLSFCIYSEKQRGDLAEELGDLIFYALALCNKYGLGPIFKHIG